MIKVQSKDRTYNSSDKTIEYLKMRIEEVEKEIENAVNHKAKLEKRLKIEEAKLNKDEKLND